MITNNWIKKGILSIPSEGRSWMHSHAYVPTPIVLDSETIRIFASFRDREGIGRVGFVDVSSDDPFKIIRTSETPCLDIGKPGTFDDNGVTPISVVSDNGKLYLYYAGWQLSDKVRYFLFSGLAVSDDYGLSFKRVSEAPILDRIDGELMLRSAPMVIKNQKGWHMIYASGSDYINVKGKLVPTYSLRYIKSADGIKWCD
jgi:hypothetical protein